MSRKRLACRYNTAKRAKTSAYKLYPANNNDDNNNGCDNDGDNCIEEVNFDKSYDQFSISLFKTVSSTKVLMDWQFTFERVMAFLKRSVNV